MPRSTRLIIPDQMAVYHVMSRTALDGFPFQDADKDRMVDMIRRFSSLYFTEILGFCIMGNHFHILVRMTPGGTRSDIIFSRTIKMGFFLLISASLNSVCWMKQSGYGAIAGMYMKQALLRNLETAPPA